MSPDDLLAMGLLFAFLSVLSVGGAITTAPEMHRFFVEQNQWMTHQQFNDAIALAQAAPGPNILFVTLLGWQAAAWVGALICTVAIMLPSSLMTLLFYRWKQRNEDTALVSALRVGLAPLAVGFTAAAGWVVASSNEAGAPAWMLTAFVIPVVVRFRINPMWMIFFGAATGIGWGLAQRGFG